MKSSHKAILGLGVLGFVAILLLGPGAGYLPQGSVSQNGQTPFIPSAPSTSTTGPGLTTFDQVKLTFNHRDALVPSTALTEGTNVKSTLVNKNSDGTYRVTGSGTGQTYTLGAADNGKAYVSWETFASGQSYVFARDRTINANPNVVESCSFADIDGDGLTEQVCTISTAGLKNQQQLSGNVPERVVTVNWYNEVALTPNTVSDISSIGTSPDDVFIEWEPTGAAGDAAFVSKVTVTLNQTDLEWDEAQSTVMIAGQPYPFTSATAKVNTGSILTYEWTFATTHSDSVKIIEFDAQGQGKTDMTVKLDNLTMDEDDDILVTLAVTTLNEVGTPTTNSDQVELEENA